MRFPEVKDAQHIDGGIKLTLEMTPELDWFSGHFEKVGILPGVAMCVFVQEYATTYLNLNLYAAFTGVVQAKFLKTILAGDTVTLTITPNLDANVVSFSAESNGAPCVSGRMGIDTTYL